ncbi:alpha/beta hydrolase [Streptomyces sp. NPDC048275]|uniref:alpha/beta hydrolase n=1 Tax=Streptomyces sp. NPDC048275 TaxID=3155629 RepID=UPI0033D7C81A
MSGVSRVVDVDGIPVSALLQEARQPRAVVVALHGGAANSTYFDYPGRPPLSLLRTGAALGFTVVAPDRPGYGSSAPYAEELAPVERRVDLAYATVDRLLAARPRGEGVFLLAHSIGCELALRMAGDPRGSELLGVEIAGTGRHHHDDAVDIMGAWRREDDWPRRSGRGVRDLIWQPDHLYASDVVGGARIVSPSPAYEGVVARNWTVDFPGLAAQVRVPVHYTLGEYERVWRPGPSALADVASMFTASPRVVVDEQADGGHNLSIGLTAMAYHLKILSFVEECVLARASAVQQRPGRAS